MSYDYKYFFVKPTSTFPFEELDDYFIDRCNYYQQYTSNYIIGSLFNSRDMQQVAYFSDKSRDSHKMSTNKIIISTNTREEKSEPRTPLEILNSIVMPMGGLNSILTTSQPVKGIVYD